MTRKVLSEFRFEPGGLNKGYASRTLYINLSENQIKEKPITEMEKDKFVGGRGFGMWYLWNATSAKTKWNDPENEIIISPGPIGGVTQYPGTGKSMVVSISPTTGSAVDSNVGGYFGPYLKFSGWDALEIKGKAEENIIVFIDGNEGTVRIEEANVDVINSHILCEELTAEYAESEEDKVNISVVASGDVAEKTHLGLLNFSFYDPRRKVVRLKQAGRGGIGSVFRDKKIAALVVRFRGTKGDLNKPADLGKIQKAGVSIHREMYLHDNNQNQMRVKGTTYLVSIMNDFDLMPVNNFKYGSHPEMHKISAEHYTKTFDLSETDGCWYGCTMACAKVINAFTLKTGPYKGQKVVVDGPEYETIAAVGSNCGIFDPDHVVEANFYCDTYAIDTISTGTLIGFLMECYENGILTKEMTGGLEFNFGNSDAFMELLHQMARGEGFGNIAGKGLRYVKNWLIEQKPEHKDFLIDIGMEVKGMEFSEYVSKESLAQQGGYGLPNKGATHDEAWLIFDDMVRNLMPTFEDKAEALHYFPLFRTWLSLVGLCKLPWNDIKPADNSETPEPSKIIKHVENYIDLFNGVTGSNIDLDKLLTQSACVYNLQRIFNLRQGYGTREFDQVPYRAVGPVTVEEYDSRQERYDKQLKELWGYSPEGKSTKEKMAVLREHREDNYQKLLDAVYKRRGWNSNAVPTIERVKELGIDFPEVLEVIEQYQ